MIKVRLSTKRGKALYERGSHWAGFSLNQIYERYSEAKRKAWEKCYDEFIRLAKVLPPRTNTGKEAE